MSEMSVSQALETVRQVLKQYKGFVALEGVLEAASLADKQTRVQQGRLEELGRKVPEAQKTLKALEERVVQQKQELARKRDEFDKKHAKRIRDASAEFARLRSEAEADLADVRRTVDDLRSRHDKEIKVFAQEKNDAEKALSEIHKKINKARRDVNSLAGVPANLRSP